MYMLRTKLKGIKASPKIKTISAKKIADARISLLPPKCVPVRTERPVDSNLLSTNVRIAFTQLLNIGGDNMFGGIIHQSKLSPPMYIFEAITILWPVLQDAEHSAAIHFAHEFIRKYGVESASRLAYLTPNFITFVNQLKPEQQAAISEQWLNVVLRVSMPKSFTYNTILKNFTQMLHTKLIAENALCKISDPKR